MIDRALYRTRQFVKAFRVSVTATDQADALRWLSPSLGTLFHSMPEPARRHHLDVFAGVRQTGPDEPDLLAAALLHDCGKEWIHPVQRAIYVLLGAIHSSLPRRAGGWLARQADHPAIGAALVAAAGGSDQTVWLIAHHAEPIDNPLLRRLQAADDAA